MTEPVNIFDPYFLRGSKELQHFLLSLLKGGLDKQARDAVGRAAAAYVNGSIGPHIGQFSQEAPDKITHTLDQRGYAVIEPIFSDQQIKKITDFLSDKPVLYGHNRPARKREARRSSIKRFARRHQIRPLQARKRVAVH